MTQMGANLQQQGVREEQFSERTQVQRENLTEQRSYREDLRADREQQKFKAEAWRTEQSLQGAGLYEGPIATLEGLDAEKRMRGFGLPETADDIRVNPMDVARSRGEPGSSDLPVVFGGGGNTVLPVRKLCDDYGRRPPRRHDRRRQGSQQRK